MRTGERGEGKWKEASWDEALDYIADKMIHIRDTYGMESMLLFNQVVGTGYVQKGAQIRMASLLGMSFATAYDYNGDISMGYTHTVGIDSIECETKSWGHAKYAILWSSNVFQTRIPEAHFLTKEAKQDNGCKIVSIDPRCSQTAKGANLWLPINPGTDGALALAMCYTLIEEGLVNWEFLRTFTDVVTLIRQDNGKRLRARDIGLGDESQFVAWDENAQKYFVLPMDALELPSDVKLSLSGHRDVEIDGQTVRVIPVYQQLEDIIMRSEYKPENVAAITDIPAATIRQVAREYATTQPASIIIGMGVNHRLHGDLTIRSILLLGALAGAHGTPGSGVTIYSGQHHFRLDISDFWFPEGKRPNMVPLHYFVLGKPTETINPKINYPKHGFKGLFVSHSNPRVTEFSEPMRKAIDDLELFVTVDFSMSPTCEYSDVVLPAPTFWEKHDMVGTGCHPYLQLQQPVVSPQYDSRTEFWMVKEVLKRVDPKLAEEYFNLDELDAIEILLKTGGHETAGITLEQLQAGPVRLNVPDPEIGADEQFIDKKPFPPRALPFKVEQQREFLKTGRMEFYKEEEIFQKMGEEFPVYKPSFGHLPEEDPQLPLAIVTPHAKWRMHSTHSNNPILLNLNRKPVVEINPRDA
ncbi:MAG: molybdopterin-dependent oxidoreductase [Abditibacteriaceae bacterium]